MAERPTGTVTFLFTDVEGSTRLLKHLRDRYGSVLAEHQRLLREAFAAHGGDEVDTQGDAFFYVFRRARDAAVAAAAGQRALVEHAWPDGTDVRVRMGMHTGEPSVTDDGRYHGLGVHRAARIMAIGHGGQVLASQATASVLSDDELDGLTLRDLGECNLKDIDRPERIYQLEIQGLRSDFPPLQAQPPDEPERANFELLAASLRANARDVGSFIEALAQKLSSAIPDTTRVDRKGFRGGGRVRKLDVALGEDHYRLEWDAGRLRSSRTRSVRGIVLKKEELGLDDWIDSLARDLATTAAESERGRDALERLLSE